MSADQESGESTVSVTDDVQPGSGERDGHDEHPSDASRGSTDRVYEDVLVPTDGSDAVQEAIDEAIALAGLSDATLHALSVVDIDDYALVPDAEVVAIEETLETAANRAVDDVRERGEAADLEVRTEVRRGTPHEEILAYAADRDVDLIVMGTHGRSNLDRVLLGSVTEKVVRNADRPVLVERLPDSESLRRDRTAA